MEKTKFYLLIISLIFLGSGCSDLNTIEPPKAPLVNSQSPVVSDSCTLPGNWDEVKNIFKDCQLKEIEKGSGYLGQFNPEGANGIFDYCNTLTFRHYQTAKGDIYSYEKVRYQHFPNSEVGEYVIPEQTYNQITNSRPCVAKENRFSNLSDDDLSGLLFPSRNRILGVDLEGVNILPTKDNPIPALIKTNTTPQTYSPPTQTPTRYCCKICTTGKACGDSCISRSYTCHKAPGCACDSN